MNNKCSIFRIHFSCQTLRETTKFYVMKNILADFFILLFHTLEILNKIIHSNSIAFLKTER